MPLVQAQLRELQGRRFPGGLFRLYLLRAFEIMALKNVLG
jgi:hypothetical protein